MNTAAYFSGNRILSPSKCLSALEKFLLVAWVTWQHIGPIINARGVGYYDWLARILEQSL